ncbi:sulfite oxidase heme-binding subunit YedZ [Phreatobacter stygius]|uniref:Protein-methionine-sulfoxide reductase heme-binding subunit MsrQ n=1 Tax=Phreatobacter stygius TaxID=1940610 RepID=A0A4D7B6J5_9HYPH|nr:protein-methionine-sulfoxide reductase heme-binding subunit MsrQ [Phreatobacter stygius]QCI65998.1 sulfoxide reductase heme-binding subunit YedZ [Phreatobacter stygius]
MLPWNDRAGRLSVLKLVFFLGILAPGLWIIAQAVTGTLGSKPVTEAIHQAGDWTVRLLLLSLAVTPFRYAFDWPKLIAIRRMVGVAALAYAVIHLGLYVVEQGYDLAKVVSEIVLRIYLTIGFAALLGLVLLGATSTDAMIKRLGTARWNRLHQLIYGLTVLALLHFFLQSKIDVTEPTLMAGLFLWLVGFRLMRRFDVKITPVSLIGLAIAAAAATALLETGWYAARTGVMASRVFMANFSIDIGLRPAAWVLITGLGIAGVTLLRRLTGEPDRGRRGRTRQPVASAAE